MLSNKIILLFRIVAFLEGLSYLLLLFIAVPIKYIHGNDSFVKILGMPHGLLFTVYIILAVYLTISQKWNLKDSAIIIIASLIPFGTFYIERKYLKKY